LKHWFVHNSAGGYVVDPIKGDVGKVTVKCLADKQILDKAKKYKDNHYKDARSSQKWCDCDHNKETTSKPKTDYDQNHSGSTHICADSGVTYPYHHGYNYNWMYNDPVIHTNNNYVASQDPLHLFSSPFSSFREIKTYKKQKIINDGGTHLMIWPTIYFFLSISLQIAYSIYFYKWRGS